MERNTPIASFDAQKLIRSVADFAEKVLDRCRDRYSSKETPLLVDGIDLETGEPVRWEGHVLSNPACQQNFLRTLDGLAALTGEDRYRQRAEEWIGHALAVLRDPASGLLHWGGHTTYDLEEGQPLVGNHELKCGYPYYRFLYQIDAEATRDFIAALWHKHIQDWSTLLFNRHGDYTQWDRSESWKREYQGGPLPIIENTMLSFINTGSDLIYAATLLFKLSGDEAPLLWARRLLQRYDDVRNETTGLGGYQFNHRNPCRVHISFKEPLAGRDDVNETTVLTNSAIETRYGRTVLTWLNLYEELGDVHGREFIDMASRDLTALAEHSYDEEDGSFNPVLLDGTKLFPSNVLEDVGYCRPQKLVQVPADGLFFYVYARAYRLAGNEAFLDMAHKLADGMGWEFGKAERKGWTIDFSTVDRVSPPSLDGRANPNQNDACALLGLLELHRTTGRDLHLTSAASLGERLVRDYRRDAFFLTGAEAAEGYSNIDNAVPLALLYLAAALEGRDVALPAFYANFTDFGPKVIIARRQRQ